ncbi:MAG TPA: nitric oxide synthase [Haliea salexigens]|uniref:Nitric oxide synthase n=1 Tax=Haliea salexigens TaxID=287487 RepID=A0A3C1KRR9_9GAMM|nr:nitric oxide synthase [Haliea sp.]HAN29357.1 nitric oxide synthase [Haliea salexigens]|tara:strand:+ start:1272 stop:3473 length:2202 start_codon:yes stop_codon:yes gene_type:complete
MLRRLHSLPGLFAALFLVVLATSGAILSLQPALERSAATVPARGEVSVAEVAQKASLAYSGIEQIERLPSGAVLVYFTQDGNSGADLINPVTGDLVTTYAPSPFFSWITDLHRAFLWDDRGRAAAGVGALIMVFMCVSGLFLLASRAGGWGKLFAPIRGSGTVNINPRLHTELARAAALGLLLSAMTGVWMSALRFELLTGVDEREADFPQAVAGTAPAPIGSLHALQQVDLMDLHQLIFPFPDNPSDVYSLRTHQGSGYIDQATGEWLSYADYGRAATVQTLIMELHTGEAYWWLGLILGLGALTVPVLAITGALIWWQRRRAMPRMQGNTSRHEADTIVLVGSETNTTWGFAKSLAEGMQVAGCRVHVAPMNRLADRYPKARRLLILTSTYGDGDAPASANQFIHKLEKMPAAFAPPWAILGFGDRQFGNFCAFADLVSEALLQRMWPQILPTEHVDRQSASSFERWGVALGTALEMPLSLRYTPVPRTTKPLILYAREDYGTLVNAHTCVLRFKSAAPRESLPAFAAGDLVGILPPGNNAPRFYSLASKSKDGVLEICVRRQEHGLCSTYLYNLSLGECVDGFIEKNSRFKPPKGKCPILLIGAGTGIGPLMGFIRDNTAHRMMHLYWGGRLPASDFLYEEELHSCLADKRLSRLHVAFSRGVQPAYVQDKLREDAVLIRTLINANAQILVCGGRQMGNDVATAMDTLLAPLSLDVATLKKSGRYLEDTY